MCLGCLISRDFGIVVVCLLGGCLFLVGFLVPLVVVWLVFVVVVVVVVICLFCVFPGGRSGGRGGGVLLKLLSDRL